MHDARVAIARGCSLCTHACNQSMQLTDARLIEVHKGIEIMGTVSAMRQLAAAHVIIRYGFMGEKREQMPSTSVVNGSAAVQCMDGCCMVHTCMRGCHRFDHLKIEGSKQRCT